MATYLAMDDPTMTEDPETKLLVYLDRTGNLEDCRNQYALYVGEKEGVYLNNGFYPRFELSVMIDPEMFLEIEGDLAYMFLNQIDTFKWLLKQTLSKYIQYLSLYQDSQRYESSGLPASVILSTAGPTSQADYKDLNVWIELTSDRVPHPEINFKPCSPAVLALQKVLGCLVNLIEPKKYKKVQLYQCVSKACRYQEYVAHDKKVLSCILTGHAMQDVPRATEVVEYCDAKFLYENDCFPLTIRIPTRIIMSELKLGEQYNVLFHYNLPMSMYCAWYISTSRPASSLSELPESIRSLIITIEEHQPQSAWTLVHYLSAELCASVAPKGIFHHLKMGLLLSLASMSNTKPAPLFCLGPEVTQLVREASTLAHHSIDMTSNPTTQGCMEGGFTEEELSAGPLHMARDGICYLGEWSKYGGGGKHSPGAKVLKALEDGYISTTAQGKSYMVPMLCSVWTTCYWVPNHKYKKTVDVKVLFENFGMPFIVDFSSEAELEEYVSFFLKKQIIGEQKEIEEEFISREDYKKYLEVVKSIQVKVDPRAKEVISNYFVATRRCRPECSLPIASISKLSTLAESHAKLRLSSAVTYEDAIAVIRLYEQSMNYVYGKSICTTGPPHMELDFTSPSQIHNTMLHFSLWLDRYIRTYSSGSSSVSRDTSVF